MPVALITGCRRSTGFGQLTAIAFAKAGYTVYATMRDETKGENLRESADSQALDIHILSHDVTSEESNSQVVSTVLEKEGRVDVLVNNAGVGAFGAVETMSE